MSPFCPGRTLATCTSSAAARLRVEITVRMARGESSQAVRADLIARYGSAISGEPPMTGSGLLVWTFPAVLGLLLAAAVATASSLRCAPRQVPSATGEDVAADAALTVRLDDELLDLD